MLPHIPSGSRRSHRDLPPQNRPTACPSSLGMTLGLDRSPEARPVLTPASACCVTPLRASRGPACLLQELASRSCPCWEHPRPGTSSAAQGSLPPEACGWVRGQGSTEMEGMGKPGVRHGAGTCPAQAGRRLVPSRGGGGTQSRGPCPFSLLPQASACAAFVHSFLHTQLSPHVASSAGPCPGLSHCCPWRGSQPQRCCCKARLHLALAGSYSSLEKGWV